ncbi:hypothetical protein F4692_001169 [Nocardioides cavernae]|uniref:Collagen-like protein n=1 Tax=Nocardioides cavernae TaxID=1921566 RepID=A0A7Y9H157_9ACTN|nr:collagen-like protein [Nocardioides cavernae]NYE36065.1 hypothetical protein [Nocardioides cavernae]
MRLSRKTTTSTTSVVTAALLLALVAAATVAVGSATGAGRTPSSLTACAAKDGGSLRLVAKKKACRPDERPVTWGKRGPRGAPGTNGVDGTNGAVGPQGPAGAPGMSGYQVVEELTPVNGFLFGTFYATCPAGKRVVGGGATAVTEEGIEQATDTFTVLSQSPTADGRRYYAGVYNTGTVVKRFVVRAICVSATT